MAEAKDIFEAKSQSVLQVLGESGTGFYVPAYQRPFAWIEDKVQKLLDDLLIGFKELAFEEEAFAFLGTIIFVHDRDYKTISPLVRAAVPSKVLTVIDGQQRLSTLLTLAVALHSDISLRVNRLGLTPSPDENPTETWLRLQSSEVLGYLEDCFRFEKIRGAGYYPRMIRAFVDQWSDVKPIYESPVARLVASYNAHLSSSPGAKFKAVDKDDLHDRFRFIQRYLDRLCTRTLKNAEKVVDPLENIDVADVLGSLTLQRALVKFEIPADVKGELQADGRQRELDLCLLLLYANFVLQRVAVTAVQGRNEQYAFEVFESLNTTGEPLTAYETFTPRVVRAEGLEQYGNSDSKTALDRIEAFLEAHKRDKVPGLTNEMLIQFALVETGEKLSSRLTEQRRFLQRSYSVVENDLSDRTKFVEQLKDVAVFQDTVWTRAQASRAPELEGLSPDSSEDFTFAIKALVAMNHTMAAAPVIRYYSASLDSEECSSGATMDAARAALAFSVLWRAATGSTSGIDGAYRDVMKGGSRFPGLARTKSDPAPAISAFKAHLRETLAEKVGDKGTWRREAANQPLYKHRSVARMILLAAYHDAVADTHTLGLIAKGKEGFNPLLIPNGLQRATTIEHIAPKSPGARGGWPVEIYDLPNTVDSIGNLVLLPQETNSMLGNRSWANKAVLYAALGCADPKEAEELLARHKELHLVTSAAEIAGHSTYLPQLEALGARGSAGLDWSIEFVKLRATTILDLAWDALYPWLGDESA